jgi:hypothetical protein
LGAGLPGTNNNYFAVADALQQPWSARFCVGLPVCDGLTDLDGRRTHIRLNMYPDGGIARLRLYGLVPMPRSIVPVRRFSLFWRGC